MSQITKDQLVVVCERYGIDMLYVFGSRAHEVAAMVGSGPPVSTPSVSSVSDVDIGVLLSPGRHLDVRDKVRLMAELEDLFDVGRVDLVVLPEASPFLAVEVIRGEVLYEADADRSAEYELYVLRRAGDLAYYERQRIEQVLGETAV